MMQLLGIKTRRAFWDCFYENSPRTPSQRKNDNRSKLQTHTFAFTGLTDGIPYGLLVFLRHGVQLNLPGLA